MRKKKIGILGGTFNPIHNGHLFIAEQVRTKLNLDKVLFMPDYIPPHIDQKSAISSVDRVNMVNLAIKDNHNFGILMDEIDRKGKSYTYDTMNALLRNNPNSDYYFIIGGDMVHYLPKWYKIDELTKIIKFVGIQRGKYDNNSKYSIIKLNVHKLDISSTLIRNSIKDGQSVRYLIPDEVLQYIKEHHIYE
ncbi:nicotinate-nucleotide adenylyltransferase [Apilactobacillus timberlakei]|uniref:Probable nicotinate-nucleotide adenylyltransferase n=1 Tax=Apilactobacillus timberlakei TaxID=2008380 RepID=A0ABY2YU89_9LACO|nr:nicotinate-nucleotide adenylyltransferase [Apilactobacillus timberlakei]TPR14035.1 nicotinate-nucleotide adenylyltransferase [Apilactobacillus timberlakei]TPR15351.1 nicotinate-nucleotide adenylyltransferase [Apilactobacillus timberlakei]TPR17242.1 nicotinate-nucleotide adenylyltransferase [Apilactobacillus timberlakei]